MYLDEMIAIIMVSIEMNEYVPQCNHPPTSRVEPQEKLTASHGEETESLIMDFFCFLSLFMSSKIKLRGLQKLQMEPSSQIAVLCRILAAPQVHVLREEQGKPPHSHPNESSQRGTGTGTRADLLCGPHHELFYREQEDVVFGIHAAFFFFFFLMLAKGFTHNKFSQG